MLAASLAACSVKDPISRELVESDSRDAWHFLTPANTNLKVHIGTHIQNKNKGRQPLSPLLGHPYNRDRSRTSMHICNQVQTTDIFTKQNYGDLSLGGKGIIFVTTHTSWMGFPSS